MSLKSLTLLCLAIGGASAQAALAQTPDSLSPAVNTSATQAPPAASQGTPAIPAPPATLAVPVGPVGPVVQTGQPPPAAADTAATAAPGVHDGPAGSSAPSSPAATSSTVVATPSPATPGSSDRIELGTTEISGNRELPKLMYIVPWQRAAVGKITGRPPNSLVDEALTPVDRTVFERQNNYFAALQAASASAPSQPAASGASPGAAGPRDER
jgi:hypothetical protein